jgi:hypothetical protein
VEHGAPQGAAVYWVFAEERGWADTRNHKDLAGRDRFVTARWPGELPPAGASVAPMTRPLQQPGNAITSCSAATCAAATGWHP